MKKKSLNSLKLNKEKVSFVGITKEIVRGGLASWRGVSCVSRCICPCEYSDSCPIRLKTNEGPCPDGTEGCV
ncbi:hypothetical protein [uncultured Kordia sp.]|uniref:hypothetical protein n=1 Tax=uncultured Kordia sp. TaxID=507699 RepID=UPI0026337D5D|nr:hypothetical protein [uncultured Kordia sp.]